MQAEYGKGNRAPPHMSATASPSQRPSRVMYSAYSLALRPVISTLIDHRPSFRKSVGYFAGVSYLYAPDLDTCITAR
jgi:hypothetical protein